MPNWFSRVRAGAVLLGAVVVVQLAISSAYLTALDSTVVHRLPVAAVGSPAVTARLASAAGASLDVRRVTSDARAFQQLKDRDVYGALLFDSHRLLVTSAGSVAAAQVLTRLVAGKHFTVSDVVPLPAGDARGSGPAMVVVAWALGGYLGAMLLGRIGGMRLTSLRRVFLRVIALACYAAVSGLALTAVVDAGLGILTGHPLALTAVGALFVFAVGCLMTMLQSMLRMGGVLVSVLLIILLGNPSAGGGQLPQQMMNAFWRAVNLVMPNPAAIKAVRDYESFGGHEAGTPLLTMALWAAVPIVVMMLLSFRNPGPQPDDGSDLAEASGAALAAGGAT